MQSDVKAFVLIKTRPTTAKATVHEVKKVDGVTEAEALWGIYDAVAVVEARNLDELDIIVCHRIKTIETIVDTVTLICKNPKIPDTPS